MHKLIKISFLIAMLSSFQMRLKGQCLAPIEFTTQPALDEFFAANPSCTTLGTITIYNTVNEEFISNLNALSNITSIDSLIIIDFLDLLDVSGLNNLTSLNSLSTVMVHDFSFCSGLTSMENIHIELHEDLLTSWEAVDFSGFNDLISANSINLGFRETFGNYINIFPNLTELNFLTFEPWFFNPDNTTHFNVLDGFHNIISASTIGIGDLNRFLANELSICNNLIEVGQLGYASETQIANSFQALQSLDSGYFILYYEQDVTLPVLETAEYLNVYLESENQSQILFSNLSHVHTLEIGSSWGSPDSIGGFLFPALQTVTNFKFQSSIAPLDPTNAQVVLYFPMLDSILENFEIEYTEIINLDAFENLEYLGGDVDIINNFNLSDCSIDALCSKLTSAPNEVNISGNTGNCADLADLATSCIIPTITGSIYYDVNCNQIFDLGDFRVANPLILNATNQPIGSSNSLGNYTIVAPPNGVITFVPQTLIGTLSSTPYSLDTDTLAGSSTVNFGLCPDMNYNDVAITLTPLSAVRYGFDTHYRIHLINNSLSNELANITLTINLFNNYSNWNISHPYSIINNVIHFDPIYLDSIEEITIDIIGNLSVWTSLGTPASANATVSIINPDQSLSNNTNVANQVVVGSYDPNDIIVNTPLIDFEQGDANGDWLTYRIRFQNTGNFPAEFVNVVSEQDELVDMSTIQMIDASHANSWSFNGREVTWFFDNIQLPDSTTDLEGSQGYIIYKVRTVAGLGVGDVLEVNAGIYFDFNEPVITNTATTEYYLCPEALVLQANATQVCENETVQLSASDGYAAYTWILNETEISNAQAVNFDAIAPGTYTIACNAVGTPNVCQSTSSIAIQVNATPATPMITQEGNTLMASGTGSFVWSLDGVELNNTSNTLEIMQTGNYSVFIDGACPSEAASGNYTYIGIEDLNQEGITLFPNPAENFITLQHVHYPSEVSIIDLTGRTCLSILHNNPHQTIDLDNLSSGTYRMQVKNAQGVWSQLFIKE